MTFSMFVASQNSCLQLHTQRMSNRLRRILYSPILIQQMFRSKIIQAITMALAVFNHGHTHIMEITEIVHVTAVTAVIEVKASHRDASVTAMVIVCVEIYFHVGAVDHQITSWLSPHTIRTHRPSRPAS